MMLSLGAKAPFTALPREFVDLDYLKDGEFRALIIICMHADSETGECFIKQRTLASMMGKSKAAISAHIKSLRAAGLLETESTQNGYGGNAHLHYRVPFWPEWQAHLRSRKAPKVVQPTDCPVQPAERYKESNQIQDNHSLHPSEPEVAENRVRASSPQVEVVVNRMIEEWSDAIGRGNTYGSWSHRPAPSLVSATHRLLQEHRPPSTDTSTIAPAVQGKLQSIWQSLGVTVAPDDLAVQAQSVIKSTPDPLPLLIHLARCIQSVWPKHHRRAPPLSQFMMYLNKAREKAGTSLATKLRKLASDLGRYHATFGQDPVTT
ncbi:helix-turn-helix domain-containing protein [Limimaricola cinnabarinus]|uniref:helix-turn-helix domain-containing protein n=1 Tax=Limimaricola cinnabarinus TaxID=1125964 RepID=UPI0005ECC72C|nr:helix-turn-helix domain-containing protein [Limimaricola cinnabarinus]